MRKKMMIFCVMLFTFSGFSQENNKKTEIVIATSAECGQCKKRLEDKLNYTKGVRYAILDLSDMRVTVGYVPKKISDAEIRAIISKIGYDADNIPADPVAQKALPACCQPGGMHKH